MPIIRLGYNTRITVEESILIDKVRSIKIIYNLKSFYIYVVVVKMNLNINN